MQTHSSFGVPLVAFAIGAFVCTAIFLAVFRDEPRPEPLVGGGIAFNTATNGSVACAPTSTLLAATSSSRSYIAIVNDGATTVYLALGATAATSSGIRLNAGGGAFEQDVTRESIFTGAIYCISSATSTVTVVQS